MLLLRTAGFLILLAFLVCMALYTLTGQPVWRQRAMVPVKWGLVLLMAFAAIWVLRRAALV
ncbi:hypothetical protein GTZ97_07285 [Aquabacterium fontiphilum]|jgi:hypothetical protein|uniref:hypothetical protein n=1 Tax=Aquabacterium fontiphilum TaxID=450365 RepID=UPI0013791102|nr:hypothetical protein [Aquabacterium fontiphilum]NBD20475.1 hypothetical protein [Aquabacterium fontiphilum]